MRIVTEPHKQNVPMLDMTTRTPGVPLTAPEALTIAEWWGTSGSALRELVNTGKADHIELLAEVLEIMTESHPRDAGNVRDLFDLYAWIMLMAEFYGKAI